MEEEQTCEAEPHLPTVRVIAGERELQELHLRPDDEESLQRYVVQPDSDDAVAYQLRVTSSAQEDQWLEIYIDGQWATSWLLHAGTEDIIEGFHVGTSIEESTVSYKVKPFLFAKPVIVEEAPLLVESSEFQGTIFIGVFDVDRSQSLFQPPSWQAEDNGASEHIVGENKTDKKHELFRGYTDLGDSQSTTGESLLSGYTSLVRGPRHLGMVELRYDTSAALMLRGVPPESLGLKVEATEEFKPDRVGLRAQRRRQEQLEQQRKSFVETCDLTAEDDECEVWVKRRRIQNSSCENLTVQDEPVRDDSIPREPP